jgi:hypothetical protein
MPEQKRSNQETFIIISIEMTITIPVIMKIINHTKMELIHNIKKKNKQKTMQNHLSVPKKITRKK